MLQTAAGYTHVVGPGCIRVLLTNFFILLQTDARIWSRLLQVIALNLFKLLLQAAGGYLCQTDVLGFQKQLQATTPSCSNLILYSTASQ